MPDIYDQHKAAFANVSAYVVAKDGERVATIAFKFSKDGAGRLYAYVHWLGIPMARGFAGGYGYDKRSAAVANAVKKLGPAQAAAALPNARELAARAAFASALTANDSGYFDRKLELAGFTVWQAV